MNIVLIDHPSEFPEDDRDHMSDTQSVDSRGGHSDFEGDPESELPQRQIQYLPSQVIWRIFQPISSGWHQKIWNPFSASALVS